jgi:hypothetical protein
MDLGEISFPLEVHRDTNSMEHKPPSPENYIRSGHRVR